VDVCGITILNETLAIFAACDVATAVGDGAGGATLGADPPPHPETSSAAASAANIRRFIKQQTILNTTRTIGVESTRPPGWRR
jgi:hypothetical protein